MEKSILKQKRRLGFSLGLILLSSEIVYTLLCLLLSYSGIEESTTISYVFNAFSLYVVAYLIVKVFLRKVENVERKEKVRLGIKKLLWYLFVAYGIGIFCSAFTTEIITLVTKPFDFDIADRVEELMSNSTPIPLVFFVAIIGPIFEEIMFRGLLLKKLRVYGDKTAIIYTSIAFGLFHTNLTQILFAGVVGLVLAYVVVKTNDIKYSIIIHMCINMISSVATIIMSDGADVLQYIYTAIVMLIVLSAIIIVPIKGAKTKLDISDNSKYEKKKLYKNIGYILSCIIVIIITILGAIK